MADLYLGLDAGTGGVRAAAIDARQRVLAEADAPLPSPEEFCGQPAQDPQLWWQALQQCIEALRAELDAAKHSLDDIVALAVDGTSGTLLLADKDLKPLLPALMYNSGGFIAQAGKIAAVAPADAIANSASSALARLLFLLEQPAADGARYALHQADWLAARLMGSGGLADESNVLKLGYDLQARRWPTWIDALSLPAGLLPKVLPVGARMGAVTAGAADQIGLRAGTAVIAGATDSNAAFVAAGARRPGEAVTSLGTTLAVKLLSPIPVTDPARGIYSHRIGDMWLAGGASNTGGGALRSFFSDAQMRKLEGKLAPEEPTGLDYYPLPAPGERFPIADAKLAPRCEPRPADDVKFFQGLLEGIADIERRGYAALAELGAPAVRQVITVGGGARNAAWTAIRARALGCKVVPGSADAAVGAAKIAAGCLANSA